MLKQLVFIFSLLGLTTAYASRPDSTFNSKRSLFVIPFASYQQETKLAGGVAFGYYFKSNDLSKISSISGSATYTTLNQFIVNITPKLYSDNKKYFLYANLNIRKYPDYFYGTGNKSGSFKTGFTSTGVHLTVQPQYRINKNLYAGIQLGYKTERISQYPDSGTTEFIYAEFGKSGWDKYQLLSMGINCTYDTRDNAFYPEKGVFLKTNMNSSPKLLPKSYQLIEAKVDFRTFIPLSPGSILAIQLYNSIIAGKTEIPFQLLQSPGGADLMRGFRYGQYRDNWLILAQAEYRLSVYKRLKAALFVSTGDVIHIQNSEIDKLKVSYGAGVRYRLNDARVHFRFDIAKNNYGDKWQFYITATEAF